MAAVVSRTKSLRDFHPHGMDSEAFESALRVSPFDPSVRCSLADIYSDGGDDARADRERRACVALKQ